MKIEEAIDFLEGEIKNSRIGLPQEIFYFVSRLTPMVNVDLLIKDERNRILLAWRDDEFAGKGWHLPGGIIRFKEKMAERIIKVMETEIGKPIKWNPEPLAMNEVICSHDTRGHFISILFDCFLSEQFVPENKNLLETQPGFLKWHNNCPLNLVQVHHMYKKYL